jgi:hypothetical protein
MSFQTSAKLACGAFHALVAKALSEIRTLVALEGRRQRL